VWLYHGIGEKKKKKPLLGTDPFKNNKKGKFIIIENRKNKIPIYFLKKTKIY